MLAIATAIHRCIDLVDGWRPTSAGQSPGQRDVGHGLDVYIWPSIGVQNGQFTPAMVCDKQ